MIVDIEKIIVEDRIRKDFGDIRELADDIEQNGLINPPVVNKEYRLLAGERRLRACRSLGWKQIEIRMMDTRDAEHELNVEISENENRKAFSKAERVDYMRRLMRIESAKAEERMKSGAKDPMQNSAQGAARKIVAEQFGISHDTMKKEMEIVDHQEVLTPADFADWDEGKLSTNKAYQKIKAELAARDKKIEELEASRPGKTEIQFYKNRIKSLDESNEDLKLQVVELEKANRKLESAQSEPQTIIQEVEVPVMPEDYEQTKRDIETLKKQADLDKLSYNELMAKYNKKCNEALELQDKITDLQHVTQEGLEHGNLSENVFYFCSLANNFVGNVGGLVWLTERIEDMSDKERDLFLKAAHALSDFASVFTQNMERSNYGRTGKPDSAVPLLAD